MIPWSVRASLLLSALVALSCGAGRGEGQVKSEELDVEGCTSGSYEMNPEFFSSSPYGDSQTLRISRSDSPESNSDTLLIALHSTEELLERFDEPVEVLLPSGSIPEGIETTFVGTPLVTMSLHLGETCDEDVIAIQAISGSITFTALHNGEPNEKKKDRLIEAEFDVLMGDPRDVVPDDAASSGYVLPGASRVTGWFRFYHRRGKPGQTFP